MLIKKPHLMIFWFLPIYIAASTLSITEIGLSSYITSIQLCLVLLGLCYILIKSTSVHFSLSVLFILLLLACNMLYSDSKEYQLVGFLMGYALMTHMIAKKNPYEIWSQYYFVSVVIAFLAIIDLIAFFLIGDFVISYRTPEVLVSGLPRINTIFDEMSHQAFFLMPAAIFSLLYKARTRYLLLIGLLSTMSVAALVLFTLALIVYFHKKLLHNLLSVSPLIIIVSLALFLGSDIIISKMSGIFVGDTLITGEQTKAGSAGNILLGIEILRTIPLKDLFLGYGYFGLAENVPQILSNSFLYPYFEVTESLKDPKSVGILNLVLYFGLFQCSIVALVLFNVKKYANDIWLYKLAIFIVFLSMMKNSHTVDYLVHMFFVFSLSWASTRSLSTEIFDQHSNIVSKKY